MSRKLIYVSGLLACFSFVINKSIIDKKYNKKIIEYLNDLLLLSPLEIISSAILKYDQLNKSADDVMNSYDKFLEFLDDAEKKKNP